MKKQKLSAAALTSLPPGDYTDHILPGLNLTVGVRRKTWSLRHRVGGRLRRDTLGHFPTMGLADAREAARKLAERVESGAPVEPPPTHPRSAAVSMGDLFDRYERHRRAKGGRGTKSLGEIMRAVRKGLRDYMALPAASFSKHDLRAARDAIAKTAPTSANRLQDYLSPILEWAAAEDIIAFNFSRSVIRVAREVKRERTLNRDEIRLMWQACDRLGPTPASQSYGRLVRFLLVTGQRRDEAAGLRFGQILDGVWRQGTDNKSGRAHSIPLPPLALQIVGTGEARDLVFPGGVGTKLSGWSKFKRRLDKLASVEGWRLHDLRRTAASAWQDGGADFLAIEALLNHTLPGVAAVYMRADMQRQKEAALTAWAGELERIVGARRAVS